MVFLFSEGCCAVTACDSRLLSRYCEDLGVQWPVSLQAQNALDKLKQIAVPAWLVYTFLSHWVTRLAQKKLAC